MKKQLVLTNNNDIAIVAQDKDLGDAENFVKSRSEQQTLNQIGAYGNTYDTETVVKYMPEPSLQISNKSIFTIISKADGRYLGDVRLVYSENDNSYEIGIVIIKSERSKGYGTQTIRLMTDYVFNQLDCTKVFLRVYRNNPRAKDLYLKLGFEYKGTSDDGYVVEGIHYLEDILELHK